MDMNIWRDRLSEKQPIMVELGFFICSEEQSVALEFSLAEKDAVTMVDALNKALREEG